MMLAISDAMLDYYLRWRLSSASWPMRRWHFVFARPIDSYLVKNEINYDNTYNNSLSHYYSSSMVNVYIDLYDRLFKQLLASFEPDGSINV